MAKLSYKILDIKTRQFAAFESNYRPEIKRLTSKTRYEFGIKRDQCLFRTVLAADFFQAELLLAKIEVEMIYKFDENVFESFIHDDKFIMPVEDIMPLVGMLYSTTRGVLVTKMEGLPMRKIILPVTLANQIVDTPLEIDLSQDCDGPLIQ